MSDSDDSETAEWEREQMLRGSQSRRQNVQHNQRTIPNIIDASIARDNVKHDMEKATASIEANKKLIGNNKLAIMRSEKRIESLRKHIQELEVNNALFSDLAQQDNTQDALELIVNYQQLISKLPEDQREMIEGLKSDLEHTDKDQLPPQQLAES